jgi:hypothetical protein
LGSAKDSVGLIGDPLVRYGDKISILLLCGLSISRVGSNGVVEKQYHKIRVANGKVGGCLVGWVNAVVGTTAILTTTSRNRLIRAASETDQTSLTVTITITVSLAFA